MKSIRYFMMKHSTRALLLTLVGLAFVGCQSRPAPEVHYYLLQPSAKDLSRGIVEISSIELPAYLKSSSLMLGVSEFEIRPAQYHLWSEPLEDGIRRVLEAELVSQLKRDDREVASTRLELKIETLHGSVDGDLILRGSWTVRDEGAERKTFVIRRQLAADGYSELVQVHVTALAELARRIAAELK